MIELVGILALALAVAGALMNNARLRACFLVWLVSNALSLAIHVAAGPWSLAVRDAIFLVLAADGWRRWRIRP